MDTALSPAMMSSEETAETQHDATTAMTESAGEHLERWKETLQTMCLGFVHDVQDKKELNVGKLGMDGAVTSDNCNAVNKLRRLLVDSLCERCHHLTAQTLCTDNQTHGSSNSQTPTPIPTT